MVIMSDAHTNNGQERGAFPHFFFLNEKNPQTVYAVKTDKQPGLKLLVNNIINKYEYKKININK